MSKTIDIFNNTRIYRKYIAPQWTRINNKLISETDIFINVLLNINQTSYSEIEKETTRDDIYKVSPNIPYMGYYTNTSDVSSPMDENLACLSSEDFINQMPYEITSIDSVNLNILDDILNIDIEYNDYVHTGIPDRFIITGKDYIYYYEYNPIINNSTLSLRYLNREAVDYIKETTISLRKSPNIEYYTLPDDFRYIFSMDKSIGEIILSKSDKYDSIFDFNNDGLIDSNDIDVVRGFVGINNEHPEWTNYYSMFDIFNKNEITQDVVNYAITLNGYTNREKYILRIDNNLEYDELLIEYSNSGKLIKKSNDLQSYYSNIFKDMVNYDLLGITFAVDYNGIGWYKSSSANTFIKLPIQQNMVISAIRIYNDCLYILSNNNIYQYELLNKAFPTYYTNSIFININNIAKSFTIDNDGTFIILDIDDNLHLTRYKYNKYYISSYNDTTYYVTTSAINSLSQPSKIWNRFTIEAFNVGLYYDYIYEDNFQLRTRIYNLSRIYRNDSLHTLESLIILDCGVENKITMPDSILLELDEEINEDYPIYITTNNGYVVNSDDINVLGTFISINTQNISNDEYISSISVRYFPKDGYRYNTVTYGYTPMYKNLIRIDNNVNDIDVSETDLYINNNLKFDDILLDDEKSRNINYGYLTPTWSNDQYFNTILEEVYAGNIGDSLQLNDIINIQSMSIIDSNSILDYDSTNEIHNRLISFNTNIYFNWIPNITNGFFVGREDGYTNVYLFLNRYKSILITSSYMTEVTIDGQLYYKYTLDQCYDDDYIIAVSSTAVPENNIFKVDTRNIVYDPLENSVYINSLYANKYLIYNSINGNNNVLDINLHPFMNNYSEYFLAFSNGEVEEETGGSSGTFMIEYQNNETEGGLLTFIIILRDNYGNPIKNIPMEISINRIFKNEFNEVIPIDDDNTILKLGGFDTYILKTETIGSVYETDDNNYYYNMIYTSSKEFDFIYPAMSENLYMSTSLYMNSIVKRTKLKGTYKLLTLNMGGIRVNQTNKITHKLTDISNSDGKIYFEYIPPTFNMLEQYVTIKIKNLNTDEVYFQTIKILPYIKTVSINNILYPSTNTYTLTEAIPFYHGSDSKFVNIKVPFNVSNINSMFIIPATHFKTFYESGLNKDLLLEYNIKHIINRISLEVNQSNPLDTKYNISLFIKDITEGYYYIIYNKIFHHNAIDGRSNFI